MRKAEYTFRFDKATADEKAAYYMKKAFGDVDVPKMPEGRRERAERFKALKRVPKKRIDVEGIILKTTASALVGAGVIGMQLLIGWVEMM